MCMDLRLVFDFGFLGFAGCSGFPGFRCLGFGFSFRLTLDVSDLLGLWFELRIVIVIRSRGFGVLGPWFLCSGCLVLLYFCAILACLGCYWILCFPVFLVLV